MVFNNKFAPKSKAAAPAKKERNVIVIKMREVGAEKSNVLCFANEVESKNKKGTKFFIGSVKARDEEGNIVKGANGFAEDSGTVFMLFPNKDGAKLMMGEDGNKAELVCQMTPSQASDKGGVYIGTGEDGTVYYADKPLPKK
jgi:hypothetical protein